MIYEHYFALTQRPFSIAPNPNFLYACGQYKEALAALEYGMLHRGGFVLLTGEVGTGKTTLCKYLLQSVPQDTEVALVLHPQLDRIELLQLICKEFGLQANDGLKESELIELLTEFLLKIYSQGGYSVLIIDEAQHLDESVLELIRLLTNLETHEDKLLQIILLGQPELRARLNQYQLRQLNQRFTARFHLKTLNFMQVKAYLEHRIEVAGGHESLFSLPAVCLLHRLTKGVPRLINVLADRCLMGCYANQKKKVSALMVWQASKEVMPKKEPFSFSFPKSLFILALLLVVLSVTNLPRYLNDSLVKPMLASKSLSSLSGSLSAMDANRVPANPCEGKYNCWSGSLPVSIVMSTQMQGKVLINGQWETFSGQALQGDRVSVALMNVDTRYLNALIKPFEKDPLIPWVRETLQAQGASDQEDYSQWQMITPESSSSQPSLIYDVVLRDMVKGFQRQHGLMVDGVLGPQTLISLSLVEQQVQTVNY